MWLNVSYVSESNDWTSWLDHIMSTCSAAGMIIGVWGDYSLVSSEHHPLLALSFLNEEHVSRMILCDDPCCSSQTHIIFYFIFFSLRLRLFYSQTQDP